MTEPDWDCEARQNSSQSHSSAHWRTLLLATAVSVAACAAAATLYAIM